ncbi:MAG: transglycosylase SLT domain-containing protein [Gallionellaceae bacterium]|nr:transglycosylase SLT domain-containing protein [Gallionellaceae bacterium]
MSAKHLSLLLLASLFLFPLASVADPVADAKLMQMSASISYDNPVIPAAARETQAEVDLWQRLRAGMKMPDLDTPLVQAQENWFINRPAYLDTAFKRARLYLFHIVEEVEARGMPAEIALLPVVESAYNPHALSPANASGIWQFIPSTGKVFGLKQNGWYDGRRDVVTATEAALDYLEKLHDMFGSWDLALAAYNCGEGCVSRAIARNQAKGQPTDYLSLNLPSETRNYVPRLLAVRNLVREPERYGMSLDALPNQPYFQQVSLPYPIEAKTAARLAGIDMDELLSLNPGFRRDVIYAESQDNLLLPWDKLDTFRANFDAAESQRIRLRSYSASKGELLSRIADRYDVTVQWLKDHNPLSVKRGKIAQAQTLMLPPAARTRVAQASVPVAAEKTTRHAAHATKARKTARASVRTHTVRRGDTLIALAKHYKVTVADIREYNGALRVLRPGTKIHIPYDS